MALFKSAAHPALYQVKQKYAKPTAFVASGIIYPVSNRMN